MEEMVEVVCRTQVAAVRNAGGTARSMTNCTKHPKGNIGVAIP